MPTRKYSHSVSFMPEKGWFITLFLTEDTSKIKTFFIADTSIKVERIIEHIESLTDQQCFDYLKGKI